MKPSQQTKRLTTALPTGLTGSEDLILRVALAGLYPSISKLERGLGLTRNTAHIHLSNAAKKFPELRLRVRHAMLTKQLEVVSKAIADSSKGMDL